MALWHQNLLQTHFTKHHMVKVHYITQKEVITQNGSIYLAIGNIKKLIYDEHCIFSGKWF